MFVPYWRVPSFDNPGKKKVLFFPWKTRVIWVPGVYIYIYYIYTHKIADFVCKYVWVCCFLCSEVLSHESSRHSNELPKAEELCTTGRAVASLLGVSTEGNQIGESDLSWPPKLPEKPWRRRTCFFACLIYTTESCRGGIFLCVAWWPNLFFSACVVYVSHGNIVGTCRYLGSTPHPACNRGKLRFIPGSPNLKMQCRPSGDWHPRGDNQSPSENGFMEPKYYAFRFGDQTPGSESNWYPFNNSEDYPPWN